MKSKFILFGFISLITVLLLGSVSRNNCNNKLVCEIVEKTKGKTSTKRSEWPYFFYDMRDETNKIISKNGWSDFLSSLGSSNSRVKIKIDRGKLENTIIRFELTVKTHYLVYIPYGSEDLRVRIKLGSNEYELVESSVYKITP